MRIEGEGVKDASGRQKSAGGLPTMNEDRPNCRCGGTPENRMDAPSPHNVDVRERAYGPPERKRSKSLSLPRWRTSFQPQSM